MKKICSVLWFLPIGLVTGLVRFIVGVVFCCTVVGIPIGKQCFKIAKLSFFPVGKAVDVNFSANPAMNILFRIIGGGFVTYVLYKIIGVVLCVTVIGIPLGKQFLKVSRLAWAPFGSHVFK